MPSRIGIRTAGAEVDRPIPCVLWVLSKSATALDRRNRGVVVEAPFPKSSRCPGTTHYPVIRNLWRTSRFLSLYAEQKKITAETIQELAFMAGCLGTWRSQETQREGNWPAWIPQWTGVLDMESLMSDYPGLPSGASPVPV